MRLPVSLLIACLLTATIAAAGPASAEPGHECTDKDIVDGSVRVTLERDCTLEVAVLEGIICVGGWGGSVEAEAAGHEATAYYCDGGLGDRVGDPVTLETTSAPGCKRIDETLLGGSVRIEQEHNCRVTLSTHFYECVWGGHWHESTVGPLTWRDYRCAPPTESETTGAQAPVDWCEVRDDTPQPIRDSVWGRYDEGADGECDVDVEPFGACVGGSGTVKEFRYDPVHVRLLICSPPPGTLPPVS